VCADDATRSLEGLTPVKKSFWEENVCHWKRSVGVWCCLMLGVVVVANSKTPQAKLSHAAASTTGQLSLMPAHVTTRDLNPAVTLSYSTLDVTELNASAYGDMEF